MPTNSYNDDIFDLIQSSDESITYVPNNALGDYVRLSVFEQNGVFRDSYYSNRFWGNNYPNNSGEYQVNLDYNSDNSNFYIQPKRTLEIDSTPQGNYNLQFDFLRDIFTDIGNEDLGTIGQLSPKFIVSEISPSRKEVRLIVRNDENNLFISTAFVTAFQGVVGSVNLNTYNFDYVLVLSNGRKIPITNYAFDNISNPGYSSLVIKLNNQLPSDVVTLDTINYPSIAKELLPTQNQNIFYVSNVSSINIGTGLDINQDYYSEILNDSDSSDIAEDYDDLINSSSAQQSSIDFISSSMYEQDINLNVDFSNFSNHIFFGSAVSKLENFKTKVSEIEDYLLIISNSLGTGGSSIQSSPHQTSLRRNYFNKIQEITNKFTPFEKFMYYDAQSSTTSSAPGIGKNLTNTVPLTNPTVIPQFDGFKTVYKHTGDGTINVIDNQYRVEDSPFFNHSGSFYLSFILKGEGNYNLSLNNTNVARSTGEVILPSDAYGGGAIVTAQATASEYRRYIFEASQSYWSPLTDPLASPDFNAGSSNVMILSGSNITGSNEITNDLTNYSTYPNQFDPEASFIGSVLPMGELFNISYIAADSNVSSSFITDIKITQNNPLNALPFGQVYSTSSTDWTNWYDGLHSSASTYDTDNIHSLKNNLPESIKTDSDSTELNTFLNMLGEHYDLIRNYIDNYSKFYKRNYKEKESVPKNLMPILGDTLGWELINPYSSSLADYFSGNSFNDNVKDIGYATWRKTLNNLIYIYKTKGTLNSVRALLNVYGYPSDVITLNEFGGSSEPNNPETITDDMEAIKTGLKNKAGNISFNLKKKELYGISVQGTRKLQFDWWMDNATGDGVEFMFASKKTNNNQILIENSGSGTENLWDLRLLATGSNQEGQLQFRLNYSTTGSSAIADNALSMSSAHLPFKLSGSVWNVYLTRETSSLNETTQSYVLYTALQDSDKITEFSAVSMSTTNTTAINNFRGSGSRHYLSSSNLYFGETLTGSLFDIRAWNTQLSASKFKQHTLNKFSTVANSETGSFGDLIYRFRLNENYASASTGNLEDANPNYFSDYSTPLTLTNDGTLYNKRIIEILQLSTRVGGLNQPNSNKILINPSLTPVRDLNPNLPSFRSVFDKKVENKNRTSNVIEISKSPTNVINDYIINQLSDKDVSGKFADPSDLEETNYDELEKFRNSIMEGVSVDINTYIDAQKNTFNKSTERALELVIPARTKLDNFGIIIKDDLLHRNKFKNPTISNETSSIFTNDEIRFFDTYIDFSDSKNVTTYSSSLDVNQIFNFTSSQQVVPYSSSLNVVNLFNFTSSKLDAPYSSSLNVTNLFKLNDSKIESLYSSSIDVNNIFNLTSSQIFKPYSSSLDVLNSFNLSSSKLDKPHSSSIDVNNIFNLSNSEIANPYSSSLNVVNLFNFTSSKLNQPYSASLDINSLFFNFTGSEVFRPYSGSNTEVRDLFLRNKLPYEDEYGNEYHYVVFQDTQNPLLRQSGSNSDYNVGYYSKEFIYYAISDVEFISSSLNSVRNVSDDPEFTRVKNKLIINKAEYENNYIYDTYWDISGSSDIKNPIFGKPMGKTTYFITSSGNVITYPSNHYIIAGTSKNAMNSSFYGGSRSVLPNGVNVVFENGEFDKEVSASFYSINIGGSDTDRVLEVIKRK